MKKLTHSVHDKITTIVQATSVLNQTPVLRLIGTTDIHHSKAQLFNIISTANDTLLSMINMNIYRPEPSFKGEMSC